MANAERCRGQVFDRQTSVTKLEKTDTAKIETLCGKLHLTLSFSAWRNKAKLKQALNIQLNNCPSKM